MMVFIVIACIAIAGLMFIPAVRKRVIAVFFTEILLAPPASARLGDDLDNLCTQLSMTVKGLTETGKYVLRFGVILAVVLPLVWRLMGPQAVKNLCYKIVIVTAAVGLAEFLWAVLYKLVFGKTEAMNGDERRAILTFRAAFYLAVILGVAWGI